MITGVYTSSTFTATWGFTPDCTGILNMSAFVVGGMAPTGIDEIAGDSVTFIYPGEVEEGLGWECVGGAVATFNGGAVLQPGSGVVGA